MSIYTVADCMDSSHYCATPSMYGDDVQHINNQIDKNKNPHPACAGLRPLSLSKCRNEGYGRRLFVSQIVLLVFAALFFAPLAMNADEKTVYDGTGTNAYVPFYSFYADYGTRSQFIIPASELTDLNGADISKLTFYYSTNYTFDEGVTVYLKEVNYTTFSSNTLEDWSTMTSVWTGPLVVSNNKLEINFTSPYPYGGGNLMIGFQVTTWGSECPNGNTWYGVTQSSNTALYNNANSSHTWNSTINPAKFLPKTTFTYTTSGGGGSGGGSASYHYELASSVESGAEYIVVYADANTVASATTFYAMDTYTASYGSGYLGYGTPVFRSGSNNSIITDISNNSITDFVWTVTSVGTNKYTFSIIDGSTTYRLWQNSPNDGYLYCSSSTYNSNNCDWTIVKSSSYEYFNIHNPYYHTQYSSYYFYIFYYSNRGFCNYYSSTAPVNTNTGYRMFLYKKVNDCPVPTSLDVSPSHNSATVSWEVDGGSGTESYNVRYTSSDPQTYTYDFESGLQGWTAIDADGDGYNWGFNSTLISHSGSGIVASASYINNVGALNPNNYLVSPQKVYLGSGASISLWACGQDDNDYYEKFRIAVSADGSNFTDVASSEKTVTHTMTQYTVDLSGVDPGQYYVAIRHYNCTNMYWLDVDDITIVEGIAWQTLDAANISSANATAIITDLDFETHYCVEVQTDCGSGSTSSWSSQECFTTLSDPCPGPTHLIVSSMTDNSATLTWDDVADSYKISWTAGGNNYSVTVTDPTYTITGLASGSTYTVEVQSVCGGENGRVSSVTFTISSYAASLVDIDYGSGTWCLGATRPVTVKFKNVSTLPWHNDGLTCNCGDNDCDGEDVNYHRTFLSYSWSSNGVFDDSEHRRIPLGMDVGPGEEVTIDLNITSEASGAQYLLFKFVRSECGWFNELPISVPITVSSSTAPLIAVNKVDCLGAASDVTLKACTSDNCEWTHISGREGVVSQSNSREYNITHPLAAQNVYRVTAGSCSNTISLNFPIGEIEINDGDPTVVNCGNSIELRASGIDGALYDWYGDAGRNTLLIGNSTVFTTPDLAENETYYTNATVQQSPKVIVYDTPGHYDLDIPTGVSMVKLEVWGAQGGTIGSFQGGKGGYSVGILEGAALDALLAETGTLYVVVGGTVDAINGVTPDRSSVIAGGYNGGGSGAVYFNRNSYYTQAQGGGGATHIAKKLPSSGNTYELKNYSSNTGDILLVAGGGSGSWCYRNPGVSCSSGYHGGGTTSGAANTYYQATTSGVGIGVTGAAYGASFGQGANYTGYPSTGALNYNFGPSGGGGGYFGGGNIQETSNDDWRYVYCHGGGSGFYNDSELTGSPQTIAGNAEMPNPYGGRTVGKTGNGYARITFYGQVCASESKQVDVRVNKPSVNITSAPSSSAVCVGGEFSFTTTARGSGDLSYQWQHDGNEPFDGDSTYSATASASDAGTYYVTVTSRVGTCEETAESNAMLTVNTPNNMANPNDYQFIWKGGTAGHTTDWNTPSNWYMNDNGTYSVASGTSLPTTSSNIYIGTANCVTADSWPSQLSGNAEASAKDITIASGTLTIPNGKKLNIAGSISGTISAQTGSTVEFVGNAAQAIHDNQTFSNVIFNKTGNSITLDNGKKITVSTQATFTNGIVNGNVEFGTGASVYQPENLTHNSFVAGKVTKRVSETENFTFPTGSATEGQPKVLGSIRVQSLSTNNVSVTFHQKSNDNGDGTHGFTLSEYPRWWNINDMCSNDGDNRFDHVSNFEYWDISAPLSGITLKVNASDAAAHFGGTAPDDGVNSNICAAAHYDCWKNLGGSATVSGSGATITVSGVNIQSSITRGDVSFDGIVTLGSKSEDVLLPIELVSFTAECDGRSSLIEWRTATEKNNEYFLLERSDDAINFVEIGRMPSAAEGGNSIEPLDYSFTDYGVHGGDNYYRLWQVDYDGTRTVSEIIVANCVEPEVGEPDVQAYPNPFSGELTLVLDNFENRPATIEVYDMLGKLIFMQKADSPQNQYQTVLNLSNLPPAAYTIRVRTNDFVINKNVIKQ